MTWENADFSPGESPRLFAGVTVAGPVNSLESMTQRQSGASLHSGVSRYRSGGSSWRGLRAWPPFLG